MRSLLPEYREIDYRRPTSDINPTSGEGDPSFQGGYFGRTLHPFETIFVKTNRQIAPEALMVHLASNQTRASGGSGSAYRACTDPGESGVNAVAWKSHRGVSTWLARRLGDSAAVLLLDGLRPYDAVRADYLRLKAYPFTREVFDFIDKHDRVYVIDQNRDGQMLQLLRMECSAAQIAKLRSVKHYNGLPLDARSVTDEIISQEGK